MKRRKFLGAVTATTAAAPVITAQRRTASPEPIALPTVRAEAAAQALPRFFSPSQFAALTKLCATLMPAFGNSPGAIEAGAPAFLDFWIGVSPATRQRLYREGLDHLDAEARRRFERPFAEIDEAQAGRILEPLIVPWTFDPPTQPHQRFLTEVRADIRAATVNSLEWTQANGATRRRRGGGGGYYWHPVDPIRS